MSKSYGNAIYLKDSSQIIRRKIATMMTDTRRKRRTDPGLPQDCPVFTLHKAFVNQDKRQELAQACLTASIGCLECKEVLIERLIQLLTPFLGEKEKIRKKSSTCLGYSGRR